MLYPRHRVPDLADRTSLATIRDALYDWAQPWTDEEWAHLRILVDLPSGPVRLTAAVVGVPPAKAAPGGAFPRRHPEVTASGSPGSPGTRGL